MSSFPTMLIMDLVIAGYGLFMVYISFWMKKNKRVHKSVLAEEEIKRCKDQEGFVNFMFSKVMLLAVVCVLTGVGGMICDYLGFSSKIVSLSILAVFLIAFGVFTHFLRLAREKFVK